MLVERHDQNVCDANHGSRTARGFDLDFSRPHTVEADNPAKSQGAHVMIFRNSARLQSSLTVRRLLIAIAIALGFLGPGKVPVNAQENAGRAAVEGDCAANGIDPDRCHCIMAEVVREHGIAATLIVTLQLSAQDEEAQALMSVVGEDEAMAASEAFDKIQNTTCSIAALAKKNSGETSSGGAVAEPLVAADKAEAPATAREQPDTSDEDSLPEWLNSELDRLVECDGVTNSSTNHPLLDPFGVSEANSEDQQISDLNNARIARPLTQQVLARLQYLNGVEACGSDN